MLAQVARALYTNGTYTARASLNGRLSNNLIYLTITGNPDNEYKRQGRHRRRLSKNTWTLHRPRKRARYRLRTLVPYT